VKLIAEPWDLGEGGYQVGNFPLRWSEWNGRYRDTVRDFWRGEDDSLGQFAYCFTGSPDLYQANGRNPSASINFITAHDGFTLNDLVSYNEKHNQANGEDSRDGESHNRSWNCGVEGETDDPDVIRLRERQRRNFLATLMLSQGVPMLLAGDEIGCTQKGNNNAYCQDNEISWRDWSLQKSNSELLDFSRELIDFRHKHPVFRRRKWFQGRPIHGFGINDLGWFNADGSEMTEKQWLVSYAKAMEIFLNGEGIVTPGRRGERIIDESFLLFFNAHYETLEFALPNVLNDREWEIVIDTNESRFLSPGKLVMGEQTVPVTDRSIMVLRRLA
jgi:glycogen operon protein